MIESYEFGAMVVDGQRYTADLIILPERIIPTWWRQEGHQLALPDLKDIVDQAFQVLVIGTGFFGLMKIALEVEREAQLRGWKLIAGNTKKAVRAFNETAAKAKTVGAFHLTC